MGIVYNYVGDACGLFLTILLLLIFYMNNNEENIRAKYMLKLIINNILICLGGILVSISNNYNISESVQLLISSFYFTACIYILSSVYLYLITLIPICLKCFKKNYIWVNTLYISIIVIMFIIGFITKEILNQPFYYVISLMKKIVFLAIFINLILGVSTVFIIRKNYISRKIIYNCAIIFPFLIIGTIIQFLFPSLKISGMVHALLILFIYVLFHCKSIDTVSGGLTDNAFIEDLKRYSNKNKKFYVVTVKLLEYEYLKKFLGKEELNVQIAEAIKQIDNKNKKIISYRESKDEVSFILEEKYTTNNIENSVKNMIRNFKENSEKYKNFYHVLHFKVIVAKCPDIIENGRDYISIRNEAYNKCDIDNIYVINEDDIKLFDSRNELLKEFNDIFNKNDARDERVLVYYQPIKDVENNTFATMEALTRLKINNKMIYPDMFIPILEKNGYIHKYSLLVLEKICLFIKELEKENIKIDGISMNFSPDEFKMNNFESDITQIMNKYQIPFNKVRIELTESTDYNNEKIIYEKMTKMQEAGFKFYLDDFGTGYSNLTKITHLKFDIIKVDKSLVWNSLDKENIKNLLIDLTSFINSSGMKVLYEGIETEDQVNISKDVKYLQGYLYSKPIPEKETIEFLKNNIKNPE